MIPLTYTALGTTILIELFVGFRLLLLAYRTRGTPEFVIGLTFFSAAATNTARALTYALVPDSLLAWVGVRALVSCTSMLMFISAWRVFRPDKRWAAALVAGAGIAVVSAIVQATLVPGGFMPSPKAPTFMFLMQPWLDLVAVGWGMAESLRYRAMMSRRLKIGLAEPLARNRFTMWAVAGMGAATFYVLGILNRADLIPGVLAVVGGPIGMLVSGACFLLTFFPPQYWRDLIERRAQTEARS